MLTKAGCQTHQLSKLQDTPTVLGGCLHRLISVGAIYWPPYLYLYQHFVFFFILFFYLVTLLHIILDVLTRIVCTIILTTNLEWSAFSHMGKIPGSYLCVYCAVCCGYVWCSTWRQMDYCSTFEGCMILDLCRYFPTNSGSWPISIFIYRHGFVLSLQWNLC